MCFIYLKETWLFDFFDLLGMERVAEMNIDARHNLGINWDQVLGNIAASIT